MFHERVEMTASESNAWFDRAFAGRPLMAIFRGLGVARTLELAARAWEIGIELIEIPIQSPADLDALAEVAALAAGSGSGSGSGRIVGAGTVTTRGQVAAARERGAAFVVSPGLDVEIVAECLDAGLPPLPGISTATELQAATGLGLTWVKVFPAVVLGSHWFSIMHGPFPAMNFVATGGLTASTAREFLDAGARAVAVGSAIENPRELAELSRLLAAGRA